MMDVLLDVLHSVRGSAPTVPDDVPIHDSYLVCTIHRAENTDCAQRLSDIIRSLAGLPITVILVVHPRLKARSESFGLNLSEGALHQCPPLPYTSLVALVANSVGVLTDSGGVQKEAFLMGVPCTTLRSETEWPETLEAGWNVVLDDMSLLEGSVLRSAPQPVESNPFGRGKAAEAAMEALVNTAADTSQRS